VAAVTGRLPLKVIRHNLKKNNCILDVLTRVCVSHIVSSSVADPDPDPEPDPDP
jgi:hypothetical protein